MTYPLIYPNGCQPPWDRDRTNLIYNFYNGETMEIRHTCYLRSGTVATIANADIDFSLRDQRFELTEIWHGTLVDGITFVNSVTFPGLISVLIPDTISTTLRRGSYIFSIKVTSKATPHTIITATEGMIMIEYAPTSDIRDIPYRDDDWTGV